MVANNRGVGGAVGHIKNKARRGKVLARLLKAKQQEKQARREERIATGLPAAVPKTIESEREVDVTFTRDHDEEAAWDQEEDEFAGHFSGAGGPPQTLVTTSRRASVLSFRFAAELAGLFPHALFKKRKGRELKALGRLAADRGFTNLVVINEDRKRVTGLLVQHLPAGPTFLFQVTNLKLRKEIKGHGNPLTTKPELILNNFLTRVGKRVARVLGALFPLDPNLQTRQVATFHNQRDYIFFRHHRYIFEERTNKRTKQTEVVSRLQELGPKFTLKLKSIQIGSFDSKHGEYEWVSAPHRQWSRRKFVN